MTNTIPPRTIRPRPGIENIHPYKPGDAIVAGVSRIIKLSSNEGAFGPSPKARAAVELAAKEMYRYPDGSASELRRSIGDFFDLDPERIVCGAGSDEIISLLCFAYSGPGDEVLYSQHGFLMYPISAHAAGATPIQAVETNLTANVDALLAAVTDKTRIVFIANPNNPTGTYLSGAELARLRAGLADNILLVIDAAYAEFAEQDDYSAGIELVKDGQNTVMTRTFSKLFALGGMRVGWAYCPSEIADVLNRVRGPFNVSAAGQAAAVASLSDIEFQKTSRAHNLKWVAKVQDHLNALGIFTTKSIGNFVLARFDSETTAEKCDTFLRDQGIIVRRMGGYGLADSLRITIGPADQMEVFLAAMDSFVETVMGGKS